MIAQGNNERAILGNGNNGDDDEVLHAVCAIRRELPDTGVLVLSQDVDAKSARDLLGDNAWGVGYLMKQHVGDLTTLTDAVHRVASGGGRLPPLAR